MAGRKISSVRAKIWRVAVMRSGWLTTLILVLLLGGLVLLVHERGKGHLARLQAGLSSKPQTQSSAMPPPGGQEPIVLQRNPTAGGTAPEFLSARLLPGRGMNMLQITAAIPSRGDVSLLASPSSMEEAYTQLNGSGVDSDGLASLTMGAAFEVPWAGRLGGVPTPDGEDVMSVWQGQTLILPGAPRDSGFAGAALGGLMLKRTADSMETHAVPDGWQSRSVYNAGGFDGHWLSQTEVTTLILMKGQAMEISVVAKNVGPVPEPVGIGWHPRFTIPSGDRANTTLRLPSTTRIEMRTAGTGAGLPSGKLLPVDGTDLDLSRPAGGKLGDHSLDETYVHLKQGVLDAAPVVEFRDVSARFGIRMTLLSRTIKAIRVDAPAGAPVVTIDPQFNYDDPFGKQWAKDEDTGMAVLQPNESVEWKIRLELFPLAATNSSHF